MTVLGYVPRAGASPSAHVADRVRLHAATPQQDLAVASVSVYADGLGSAGAGTALLLPLAYDLDTGELLGEGDELAVPYGQPEGWLALRREAGAIARLPGGREALIGFALGGDTNVLRLSTVTGSGVDRYTVTDTYADGPPDPITLGAPSSTQLAMFAQAFAPYAPPEFEGDEHLARLGFQSAQRALEGAPLGGYVRGTCGWHGTKTHPERGAFALARTGGPFEDLVGERVRVTRGRRSVFAYVYEERPSLLQDLTLTRRYWLAIGDLWEVEASVKVEAVG